MNGRSLVLNSEGPEKMWSQPNSRYYLAMAKRG